MRPPDAPSSPPRIDCEKAHPQSCRRALPSRVTHPWRHRVRGEAAAVNDGYVCYVSTRACAMISSATRCRYPIVVSRQPPLVARVQPHRRPRRGGASSSFSGAVRAFLRRRRFEKQDLHGFLDDLHLLRGVPRAPREPSHRLQTRVEALEQEPVAIPVAQRETREAVPALPALHVPRRNPDHTDRVRPSAEDARRRRVPLVPPAPSLDGP